MQEIYYDTKSIGGFGGVSRLAAAANTNKAKEWLRSQRVYTLHKPARARYQTRVYKVGGIDYLWQADLAEFGHYHAENEGL